MRIQNRLLWLGLAISAALIFILGLKINQLHDQQRWLSQRISQPYEGMYVPVYPAKSLDGDDLQLGQPANGFQVLYFFSPGCPYCEASTPWVKSLASELKRSHAEDVQMLGVSHSTVADARKYAADQGLSFPIVATTDRRMASLFRARRVPVVLVIDAEGKINHSQLGAIDTREQVDALLAAVRHTDAGRTANQSMEKPYDSAHD